MNVTAAASRREPGAKVALAAGAIWGAASYCDVIFTRPWPSAYFVLALVVTASFMLLLFAPVHPESHLRNAWSSLLLMYVWVFIGLVGWFLRQREGLGLSNAAMLFREPFLLVASAALLRLIQSGRANVERFMSGLLWVGVSLLWVAIAHPSTDPATEGTRLGTSVGLNPNNVGFMGALVAVWTLSHFLAGPGLRLRTCLDVALLLSGVWAVFLSQSRTAMACMALGVLCLLAHARWTLRTMLVFATIVVAVCVYSGSLKEVARWDTTTGRDATTTPLAGREELFQEGWARFQRSPLIGDGFSEDTIRDSFHNGYLDTLVKTGAVGLTAILVLLAVAAAKSCFSRTPLHWPQAILLMGMAQSLVEARMLGYANLGSVVFLLALLLILTEDLQTVTGEERRACRQEAGPEPQPALSTSAGALASFPLQEEGR